MHPDLEKLLDLQAKDLILLATDVRLKSLADETAALDAALDKARADLDAARRRGGAGLRARAGGVAAAPAPVGGGDRSRHEFRR